MDLFDLVKACARRWYVVLPLLAIAAAYSYHLYSSVKPMYYSSAVVSIAPPSNRLDPVIDGTPVPRNGLIDLGGASLVTNLTTLALKDSTVAAAVVAGGGQPNYSVRMFPVATGQLELPLLLIEASENDPETATKTIQLAVDQVGPTLRALQQSANVPDSQMVTPFVPSPPSAPVAAVPSRTRSTFVIFAAGTVIALLVGLLFDTVMLRLKARRQRRRDAGGRRRRGETIPEPAAAPEDAETRAVAGQP